MIRPQLPTRLVLAASVLAAFISIDMIGVNAQSAPYNAAVEGKLWKQLDPWGVNVGRNNEIIWPDRRDLNNIPGSDPDSRTDTGDTNVYNDPIYQSVGPFGGPTWGAGLTSMQAAEIDFARLVNEGECTFSHEFDYDIHWSIYWPQVRICKGPEFPPGSGEFAKLPPAPGRLLNPVGLATSGKKVFVTDLFNHRVQAFDFYGNHLPMRYPIGNGTPGDQAYDYDAEYPGLNYRPYANVSGFENFGFSGLQLSGPAGIAVDARTVNDIEAPRLLIADSDNYRIALFNDDGSPAFGDFETPIDVRLAVPRNGSNQPILPDNDPAYAFKPDQIAISPGAIIRQPSPETPVLAGDPDFNKRIVVADRIHCYMAIMDVNFHVIKTFPPTLPSQTQHDACQENQDGNHPALPGEFATITGVKVDTNGTIYVADNALNVIRVFDRNGTLIASIGEPGGTNPGGQGNLLGPVGVFIDEKYNRLGVIDQGHGRAVFYSLANGPANATFEFQIETTVAVDDFPMGVIMQYGEVEDELDPKGRIMVTDPFRRRVLRWELPELVIINETANITNYSVSPKEGVGSFDVAVPFQKLSPVFDVRVEVNPVVPCAVDGNGVPTDHTACVAIVPGSIVPSLATRPDIAHGSLVHYTFQFTSTLDEAKFDIKAIGCATDGCTTPTVRAPDVNALARALCDACEASHEVFFDGPNLGEPDPALLVDTPPTVTDEFGHEITGWYNRPVFVRIQPVNPEGTEENDPNRVVAIGWSYGGVSNVNYEQTLTEVTIPDGGYLDVPVAITGVSWVTYRPITLGGAAGAPVDVVLPVDMLPPSMHFDAWPTPSGVDGTIDWYNDDVVGTYTLTDPHSGPTAPTGSVTFTGEGRDLSLEVTFQDRVDNAATVDSSDVSHRGKSIYIDRFPPDFPDPPSFEVVATGTDESGDYADIAASRFTLSVTDPLLADGSAGSGPVNVQVGNRATLRVRDGGTIYFDAIDKAGNPSVGSATITVTPRVAVRVTASVEGGLYSYDAIGHPATNCLIEPEGGDAFPGTLRYATGAGHGTVVDVPTNAGVYTAFCEFAGNETYLPVTANATITITKAQPIVSVTGGVFDYNAQPRASTCTAAGVYGVTPTLAITYGAGSEPINAGPAVPVRCDYAGDENHFPAFDTDSITILKLRPTAVTTGFLGNYDAQSHPSTCTISGVVGYEPTFSLTYNGTGNVPLNAGPAVPVRCEYAGDQNHEPAVATNTITINKLRPVVTVTGGTFVYDGLAHGSTAQVTGVLGIPATCSLTYSSTTAPINVTVPSVGVRCDFAGDINHEAAFGTNTLIITPRPIKIVSPDQTIYVTDPIPSFPYTLHPSSLPLVGTDTLSGQLGGIPLVAVVGRYFVNIGTVTAGPNYQVLFDGAILDILPILPINLPPDAVNDSATTLAGTPVAITVLGNDSDPNSDPLTIPSFTQPTVTKGSVVLTSDNKFIFTPAPGFVGEATFTYTISDGRGGFDTATVTVTVTTPPTCSLGGMTTFTQGGWGGTPNGNNPAMLLQNKFAQVYPSGYVRIGGTKTLTFTSSSAIRTFLPAGGTAAVLTGSANVNNPTSSTAGVFAGQMLAMQLNLDFSDAGVTKPGLGELVYEGYSVREIMELANQVLGGDTSILSYYGMSVSELSSLIASFNENFDNGTINNGVLSCPEAPTTCGPTQISLVASSSTSGTPGNIRTFSAGGVSVRASGFSRVKGTNGAWSTAFLGAFGTYGLGVTDGSEGSGADSSHKVDNIGERQNYILFEFSQPVAVTKAFLDYIGADGDVTVWLGTKNDPYNAHQTLSDSFLTSLGTPQADGSSSTADRWAVFNGSGATANVLVIAADVNDSTPEDEFKISKLEFACASTPNAVPVVTASNKTNLEGDAVSVQIVATDGDNDTLTYSATGLPAGLTMNVSTGLITGTLPYTASGTYNVTVRVVDADGAEATATFVWTVTNKNQPPTIAPANRSNNKGTTASGSVTGTDPDGDSPLTYTASGLPDGVVMSTAGVFSGTFTKAGTFTVTITVKDPSLAAGTGTFVWTVVQPNNPPTVTASNRTNAENTSVSVSIVGSDPDGGTLTYTANGLPPGLTMSTSGQITGTLGYASAGTYNVTVTVKDSGNLTGTATFVWTVTNVNRAPDAVNDSVTTSKNTSKTITVLSNDTDPDGDTRTVTAVTQPSKGSVVKNSNGTITFTPKSNWTGTVTFTYTISDGKGGTDTATVTVKVVSSHSSGDGCDDHY